MKKKTGCLPLIAAIIVVVVVVVVVVIVVVKLRMGPMLWLWFKLMSWKLERTYASFEVPLPN